jgi:hypothetical protein
MLDNFGEQIILRGIHLVQEMIGQSFVEIAEDELSLLDL